VKQNAIQSISNAVGLMRNAKEEVSEQAGSNIPYMLKNHTEYPISYLAVNLVVSEEKKDELVVIEPSGAKPLNFGKARHKSSEVALWQY
jgi:hypothetical protein